MSMGSGPHLRTAQPGRDQLGISLQWQVETDLERTSEAEVRFIAETDDQTRVVLEHRNIHRHGDGWEQMHGAVGSPDGWDVGLQRFAARIAEGPLPDPS
jgi:hypothetical protein